ncbi:M48 family metallopeptidase [Pelagimonas varians]|uniref:Metalloprotease LoiP n=1 Tax=Pelagimonas varians TaxID=696760 RepID=A0A238KAQ1_9RHOB|nr:M48 family metallopeptidase [Pelagimonas varians]PYG31236.1 peptidase M48-like protein [Pelagimonas varians]SMX39919.1 Metalloprotease LoiP precursor [Pelagimonas varians]
MSDALFPPARRDHHTGRFFDGIVPMPIKAEVWVDASQRALIIETTDITETWPLLDVRLIPDQADKARLVLRLHGDPLRRLVLPDHRLLPDLPHATRRAPVIQRSKLFVWAAAAVASVGLIAFVLVPLMADQLAEFIPPEGEHALGEVTLEQIRGALSENVDGVHFCTKAPGRSALDQMQNRLTQAMDAPPQLTVHVLDHPMVNAFALPGGHIVLFKGLIDKAADPEEIAAVFAHEIGHVVSRDPTRHALRSAGSIGVLGLLFGDFAGGAMMLLLTEQLIAAQYSRDAEAQADVFAYQVLQRAGISPAELADMFERFRSLGGEISGIEAHFMSHPALGDRIAQARAAVPTGFESRALLSQSQWADLQTICDQTSTFDQAQ